MDHLNHFISIILPNFNHASFLKERLDSIFNQTYQNFELIILDDCSTDTSLEILEKYKNHSKVSHFIINKQNSGSPFLQWQKGLKLAKGDFIWIAESDDFCDLNFLESNLKCLESADVAVAKTIAFLNEAKNNKVTHPAFNSNKQANPILYCPILNVSSVLFKASLLDNVLDDYYTTFNIMGDRVFYFEGFRNSDLVYNDNTTNYFRQSTSSISKLKHRDIEYYSKYFNEHCRFIFYAREKDKSISNEIIVGYIHRFFGRIKNRVSKNQKYSFAYMRLYLNYKYNLLKV